MHRILSNEKAACKILVTGANALGGNSQNFLKLILNIFATFRCFYKAIIHRKQVVYVFLQLLTLTFLIPVSKTT